MTLQGNYIGWNDGFSFKSGSGIVSLNDLTSEITNGKKI